MSKLIKRGLLGLATTAMAASAVVAGSGNAMASNGDWGFSYTGNFQAAHGVTGVDPAHGATLNCLTQPGCTYTPGMTFVATAVTGGTFALPGGSAPFQVVDALGNFGAVAGTCVGTTVVTCTVSSTGNAPVNGGLRINANYTLTVPTYVPIGAVAVDYTWHDPSGMAQNNDSNDHFYTYVAP
ncbi:hypothetical protein [Kitasatospora sp. GAS204B]|uniref:hypothetical protein n=1 Tax=unclassified Kitasatospora TaxID=2633591 RepID=UPI0024744853|nr:hypothetical protein [Kitasatospora sp. GAS204B]MDH6119776.1 hypothetical protein [Kitasatospora sp. GAS204B]